MRRLALIVLFNLAVLAAVEVGLRAGMDEDRLAPDRATRRAHLLLSDRLYRHDRNLIYSLQPSFHDVYPARALLPGRNPTYEVNTNERGFRTPAFRSEKARGVFRILCMGDSSTFGFQVDDDEAYPQRLGRELTRAYPGKFEVINLGVPGYSSRRGIELLRRQALGFEPDLVTFAFGTNDRFFKRPMNDDEVIRLNQSASGTLLRAVRNLLGRTYTYRFLAASLAPLAAQPRERRAGGGRGRHRVSLSGMRRAIVEAERLLAERGAALVLLDTDFAATDARQALEQAAAELGLDLLDMRALLDAERRRRSARLEEDLALPPPRSPPAGTFLLRVLAPGRLGIVVHARSFGRPPVEVAMHDDGTGGDQRAGDAVWSAHLTGQPGQRPIYTYWETTEEGPVKEFEDNTFRPLSRVEVVPPSRIADIDLFGDYALKSDGSHPDAEGHRLIAARLYDYIVAREDVAAFLAEP